MTESDTSKGLKVDERAKTDAQALKRMVRRYSPDRLLRRPVQVDGGVIVSTERSNGRLVVRVE